MPNAGCVRSQARSECLHPFSAGSYDNLPGNPAGVVAGEERGCQSNIFRLGDPAKRRLPVLLLSKFTLVEPGGTQALGFDHAGVKRVHPDLTRAKLQREGNRYCIYRSLACTVGGGLRSWHGANNGTDINDRTALR